MVTLVINLALLSYVAALFWYAKKRGSKGRFCLATIYFGIAPPAVLLAIQSGINGNGFMAALQLLMALAALGGSLHIRAENTRVASTKIER